MDITYVGQLLEDVAEYHYLTDGARAVMKIFVDKHDRIWIAPINGAFHDAQITKGVTHRHTDDQLAGLIGEDNASVICLGGIAGYIIPRIGTLMARVYVPE